MSDTFISHFNNTPFTQQGLKINTYLSGKSNMLLYELNLWLFGMISYWQSFQVSFLQEETHKKSSVYFTLTLRAQECDSDRKNKTQADELIS